MNSVALGHHAVQDRVGVEGVSSGHADLWVIESLGHAGSVFVVREFWDLLRNDP